MWFWGVKLQYDDAGYTCKVTLQRQFSKRVKSKMNYELEREPQISYEMSYMWMTIMNVSYHFDITCKRVSSDI